jgi:glycosyltransferase involved in cell wall biosynthesis
MVSDFIRSKHIEYLPDIEIKSSRIYNFISSEDLPKSPIKEDYFVYTGRLSAEKGVDTLLKAWAKFPELKLKILGTGDYESELKRLAKKLQLENRVEFLGFHQSDRVLREVAGAKFLVIPSEWYENNPLSVIESMAVGTPVIGSDIGGIPELVTLDRGFLYKASDEVELVQMIKAAISFSPEKYSEMSMNGRKFVAEHMNKEHFYSQLMSVYKQLFN